MITNNLTAAMALSEEVTNRIIITGGELRLPVCDGLGDEVVSIRSLVISSLLRSLSSGG